MKIANNKARSFVENCKLFKANNLFSEFVGNAYVVYSYGHHWPLFVYNFGKWYENKERYSNSTSRHRSHCRPNTNTILLSNTEMNNVIQLTELSQLK